MDISEAVLYTAGHLAEGKNAVPANVIRTMTRPWDEGATFSVFRIYYLRAEGSLMY